MLTHARWTRVLLLALMLNGHAGGAALTPITLPGIADSVIALPGGDLLFNDTHGPTLSRYVPATGEVIEIPMLTPQTRNAVLGADGRVWFTIDSTRQIGRYALLSGLLDLFPLPDNVSGSFGGIVLGLDGSLWATATESNRILRILPTGLMSTYDLPSFDPRPIGIAQGPDGNIWFAERNAKKIGRITPTGTVTEFAVPALLVTGPAQIVRGNDGGLWFATDDGFGRVATNGAITVFPTGPQSASGRLVLAPDGTLWLATGDGGVIQFTPPSGITRLKLWDPPAQSAGMLFDAAGNLYVTDASLRQFGRAARLAGAGATPGDAAVIEFYNSILNHYFITASAEEAAGIDAGTAGPGWSRTGETWAAWLGGPLPGATEVCRFYGNAAVSPLTGQRLGPNSHFYTFQGPECEQVKNDPGWVYEAPNKYFTVQPLSGQCPAGTLPVLRAYNKRFAQNDSNHRYTVRQAIYDQMTAQGWQGEGVVMCTATAAP